MAGSVQVVSQVEEGGHLGRISMAAYVDAGPATLPRPYRVLDSYAFAVVRRGTGSYFAPGEDPIPVTAGDALLVVPGEPHWYGPDTTWDETFVVFDGPLFDLMAEAGVLTPECSVRSLPASKEWGQSLGRLVERTRAVSRTTEHDRAVLELAGLLVELYTVDTTPLASSPSIRQATDILAADLRGELDLVDVAKRVGLTYETLRKQFRGEVGVPPARFREDRRIEAAKTLLRVTSMTHASIAASLGFADEHHFSKRFRAFAGISPRNYRKQ